MNFISIVAEPAIIIITVFFAFFMITVVSSYSRVKRNLAQVYNFLHSLNKKELSYRFKELDDFMTQNSYTTTPWEDFKNVLIFPEKLYVASKSTNHSNEIYLTVDASYFFNEESLIYSAINYKFIQAMPTLLTGLGPFFTFLKIAFAFTVLNLANTENVGESLNNLIGNIQMAALCSVFAVGFSLLFMFIEKTLYNKMCKKYYLLIQKEFIRLFDVVTSEGFLIDLVKESKIQSVSISKLLSEFPDVFAKTMEKSFSETTVPYLENILYSLNKLNENLDKGNGGDVVDKLF